MDVSVEPKVPKKSPTEPPEEEVEGEEYPEGTFYHQAVGKVLEGILRDSIQKFLESNKVIKRNQHGFMKDRSCQTNLLGFYETVNATLATEFILMGFEKLHKLQVLIFLLVLMIYCMTICGNLMIITLVCYSKNLQSPMYFFLTQLSLSDILLTTDIVPKMLEVVLNGVSAISFIGCITQFFFFSFSECLQCFMLTVMSYDRYLAICNPLCYVSIMNHNLCLKMVIMSWLLSFSVALMNTVSVSSLQFCGSNIIDHFFCDYSPLLKLSCSDTYIVELDGMISSYPVIVFPFVIIIISYINIIWIIIRIPSASGRQKTFSTCSSHLTAVSSFYTTLISMYVLPAREQSMSMSKVRSLLYTVVTPLLNPIIYSLRNKDIKNAFNKAINYFTK
ncbi:olfactory receptor 10A7-like [Pseudophryne corroboree]|uniref:olfactory receptor 10A7-like n=1 Tax=Pseudophryne corroboree TaxID=495146 RepID=UPI0030812432